MYLWGVGFSSTHRFLCHRLYAQLPASFRIEKFTYFIGGCFQIKKLKGQLEERQKNGKLDNLHPGSDVLENGTDMHVMDLQRDANRQISDLKFKLAKSEQEITALEQNVIRLESQVSRYKSAAENAEKIEDELKAEKRKLQRELRCALDKTEELEVSNGHLVKRLEKMKANRSALLSQQ